MANSKLRFAIVASFSMGLAHAATVADELAAGKSPLNAAIAAMQSRDLTPESVVTAIRAAKNSSIDDGMKSVDDATEILLLAMEYFPQWDAQLIALLAESFPDVVIDTAALAASIDSPTFSAMLVAITQEAPGLILEISQAVAQVAPEKVPQMIAVIASTNSALAFDAQNAANFEAGTVLENQDAAFDPINTETRASAS